MTGRVIGVALKKKPQSQMSFLERVVVSEELGIVGDCRGKGGSKGKRQVTILSFEQWREACNELGRYFSWGTRRANVLVEDLRFSQEDVGKIILLGPDVRLEITGETKPCERMDEVCQGLKAVLAKGYRGGVTCRVLNGGAISHGCHAVFSPN